MKRVAFVIESFEWLGGTNYYRSLFSAIHADPGKSFDLLVFVPYRTKQHDLENFRTTRVIRSKLLDRTGPLGILRRVVRKLCGGTDYVLYGLLAWYRIEILSHYAGKLPHRRSMKRIGWVPDLQHIHLPEFFTPEDRAARIKAVNDVVKDSDLVVVSSEAAKKDIIFASSVSASKVYVLHFVPNLEHVNELLLSKEVLCKKYDIPSRYIYLPNQFWVHKNHKTVIEALWRAASRGVNLTVVASGSTSDYRAPSHFDELMKLASNLGVTPCFKAIGIVPYRDLISLMMNAAAVLNPSRFEGWSTTVEEAKALGKVVLLSDIPVHREQNPDRAIYFDPNDAEALCQGMLSVMSAVRLTDPLYNPNWVSANRRAQIAFGVAYSEAVARCGELES